MPLDLILGTAGHIDHGKTSLVRALTGVDTDRLPEEKKRGITIELGFAQLELGDVRLGIVDVPGHERLVRTMLAGATGIDVALLVVAADDSVKPQTREHFEILRLLDLDAGVIALTKCDLAEPDWIDLVEQEVRDLAAGTFLAEAPIVRTSATTGAGLDELRAALAAAAERIAAGAGDRAEGGPFRLAIDRSFTVAGHGTVVTGSVARGTARVGDELAIEPGGIAVRVRGLQHHDQQVESVHRGQRAAINLAGVHHDQIGRGQELATPGHLVPARRITVRLDLLASAPRPIKDRARIRVHLGTAELMAGVRLLEGELLEPGNSSIAQLFLEAAAVATWGQPLVVRSESPVETIGGGVVLDPGAARIRRRDTARVAQARRLADVDPQARASAALYFTGLAGGRLEDLPRTAGVEQPAEVVAALRESGVLVDLPLTTSRTLTVQRDALDEVHTRIEQALEKMHVEAPLVRWLDRGRLRGHFTWLGPPEVFDAVLVRLAESGRVQLAARGVALAGRGPQLSKNEQKLFEEIVAEYGEAGFQPPTVAEIQKRTTRNQAAVPQLAELAVAEGELVDVGGGFLLHRDVEARLRKTLAENLDGRGLTLSEIRELLGTSRKYAVPFCEYLDRVGFTRREGDVRVLAK